MHPFASLARALMVATPVALAACGGSSTDTPAFSTGLPRDEALVDLDAAEVNVLCTNVARFLLNERSDVTCRSLAVTVSSALASLTAVSTEAEIRQQCVDFEATCHRRLDEGKSLSCNASMLKDCSATVADYEACFIEGVDTANRATPRCSELTFENLRQVPPFPTDFDARSGPACQKFVERCPNGDSIVSTTAPTGADAGTP